MFDLLKLVVEPTEIMLCLVVVCCLILSELVLSWEIEDLTI